ncbi:MAG: bifunctional phosphopantothenoylcysteine decarboxylase/phosphopantothenate--cysteine ligase CoaBC [bacterium]
MGEKANFRGRKILLGVTGGISVYKSAELVREFIRRGAEVSVVMTENATRFITPLTMESLSRNPVGLDMFSLTDERTIGHIERAKWADLFLVAPATANYLAKAACGIADDLLTTISLVARCPVAVAPAMNTNMWSHPTVQNNIRTLEERGVKIIPPGEGELACGDEGKGRLAELDIIIEAAQELFYGAGDLSGIRVLVTAGPTRESLDPVRFISNPSSGKMGYAIAEAGRDRGAFVTLISGPTSLEDPDGIETIRVGTAEEMLAAARDHIEANQWLIMTAAVADYRPVKRSTRKIKKNGKKKITLEMESNPDILKELATAKGNRLYIGFAAESESLEDNARKKLLSKGLDLIVANDITERDSGFEKDENRATLLGREGYVERFPLMSKLELAHRILDHSSVLWRAAVKNG